MNLSWHRRRGSVARPELPTPSPWPSPQDYVLVEHPRMGVCCITECADGFGVLWSWSGGRWSRHGGSLVAPRRKQAQSFRGVYEPASDRILCFGLEGDELGFRGVLVAVTEEGAELVHDTGELPVGPANATHDFGCIFGTDPSRGTCIVLGAERLWERDSDGIWRVAAEIDPALTSKKWYPGSHGAAYDAAGSQLVFGWLDWRDFSIRLLGWDGGSLQELPVAGLPRRFTARGGAALAVHPVHGLALVFGGGAGVYALGDDRSWRPVADADVPKFAASRALFESGHGALWVGAGTYDGPAGHPRGDDAFYRGPERIGQAWLGAGSASTQRVLAWHAGGVFELEAGWVASASDGEHLWAIAADGEVWQRQGDEWKSIGAAHRCFTDARSVASVAVPDRLIAVVERADGECLTMVWEGADWREIAREQAPRGYENHVLRRRVLLDDRIHGRILRYDGGEAFELAGQGWPRVPALDLGHGDLQPVLFRDPQTGRVIAVRPQARQVLLIERDGAREVATLEKPVDGFEPDAWHRERPLSADWTYDPDGRELRLWVDDELDECFALRLGPVLDRL